MKETRIYVVSEVSRDGEPYMLDIFDVAFWSDEDFIEEAEGQGWVWSSMESYANDYNNRVKSLPEREHSIMRIIEVEIS